MPVQHPGGETLPLLNLTDQPARPPADRAKRSDKREPLMNIAEVADRLGVSVRHIRRLVDERRIPFVKWSHLLRFDPGEIEAWLDTARWRPA